MAHLLVSFDGALQLVHLGLHHLSLFYLIILHLHLSLHTVLQCSQLALVLFPESNITTED